MASFLIEYNDAEGRALMKEVEAPSREEAWARAGFWLEASDPGRTQIVSIYRKPDKPIPNYVRDFPVFIVNSGIVIVDDPAEGRKLDQILNALATLASNQEKLMALIDDLQADVASNTDAIASAVTLLQNLKAALDAAGTDPVKLQAVKDALEKNTADLAAAVAANTPAAPPAP